jgi:hypothetical protein
MIFSGVDDLGDRLVVDAQIRRDAVQRRSLSVCRQDRRDDRYGLRGRTCIDQGVRVRRDPPPHPHADRVQIPRSLRPDPHALSAVSEVRKQVRVRSAQWL